MVTHEILMKLVVIILYLDSDLSIHAANFKQKKGKPSMNSLMDVSTKEETS